MEECPRCGEEISENINFCPKCGTNLETGKKGEKAKQVERKINLEKDKQKAERYRKVGTLLATALTIPGLLALYSVFTTPESHKETYPLLGEVTVTHPYHDLVKNIGFLLLFLGIVGIVIDIYYRKKKEQIKERKLELN